MKEKYNQIIDDAYQNYITQTRIEFNEWRKNNPDVLVDYREDTKDLFVQSIKEDKHWFSSEKGFSEKWGLKIEERELSLEERNDYYTSNYLGLDCDSHEELNKLGDIPTKLITITYNNETMESYE